METLFIQGLYKILCAAYLIATSCINLNLYLIAVFYGKKFNQPSPRGGFVVSILFALLYVASFFFNDSRGSSGWDALRIARFFFLSISAVSSVWSSTFLYITMRKPRK